MLLLFDCIVCADVLTGRVNYCTLVSTNSTGKLREDGGGDDEVCHHKQTRRAQEQQ
jgi:hypothetical protein